MARARSTFGKLQRDQAKKDRAKAKMDDRISRQGGQGGSQRAGRAVPVGRRGGPDPSARGVRRTARGPGRGPDLARRLRGPPGGAAGQAGRLTGRPCRASRRPRSRLEAGRQPASRPSSQRRNPAALEWTPFMMSELLLVRGVDVAQQRIEPRRQCSRRCRLPRGRPSPPSRPTAAASRPPRPAAPRAARAGRSAPARCPTGAGRRTWPVTTSAWSRSKSGGGVAGRSTPPSGSLTPTASPAKSTPLNESCRPTWCLACPGESTATRLRPGPDLDLLPVVEHVQALGRRGVEAAVEGVEQRAVDARGRIDETRAGRPGAGPPSRGRRPWPRERRGRRRPRRRRGRGGCASRRHRPARPDRPRSGPARRAAPAPTSGSRSRSAPAPGPQSGSRR